MTDTLYISYKLLIIFDYAALRIRTRRAHPDHQPAPGNPTSKLLEADPSDPAANLAQNPRRHRHESIQAQLPSLQAVVGHRTLKLAILKRAHPGINLELRAVVRVPGVEGGLHAGEQDFPHGHRERNRVFLQVPDRQGQAHQVSAR